MTVWIVTGYYDYEYENILGVFHDEDKAKEYKAHLESSLCEYDGYNLENYEVQ